MFSENNKISGRQLFRLLSYDLIGLSTLLLPPLLAKCAGPDGIFCLLLGTLGAWAYLGLLSLVLKKIDVDFQTMIRERCGTFFEKIVLFFYFLYFLLFSVVTALFFVRLVLACLLQEESFFLILGLLLLLVGYGVRCGIEGRARVYEFLFWILFLPLLLMLLGSVKMVDTDLWTPLGNTSVANFCKGSYLVFLSESFLFSLLFFYPYAKNKKTLLQNGRRALFFMSGLNGILYLILLGVFGGPALSGMNYPAITLMSIVQIPGGFLKRTDAFMFGIWFFTLYALLNSLIFYTAKVGKQMIKRGREDLLTGGVLVLVFGLVSLAYETVFWEKMFEKLLVTYGTPIAMLIPFGIALIPKRTGKRDKSRQEEDLAKKEEES